MKIHPRSSDINYKVFKLGNVVLGNNINSEECLDEYNYSKVDVLDYKENYMLSYYLNKDILPFMEAFYKSNGINFNTLKRIKYYNDDENYWPFVMLEDKDNISYLRLIDPYEHEDFILLSVSNNIRLIKGLENEPEFCYRYQRKIPIYHLADQNY